MDDRLTRKEWASAAHGQAGIRRNGFSGFMQALLSTGKNKVLGGAVLAAAMSVGQAQNAVPEHWISYATMTGNHLQARLSEGSGDLVTRLHGWMHDGQIRSGNEFPVIVQIWIAPDGVISRSEFETLGDAQADADLRAFLAAQVLPEFPPADMLQPLVLRLTLRINPEIQSTLD